MALTLSSSLLYNTKTYAGGDENCTDLKVIFARGSGEKLNGVNYQQFYNNLAQELAKIPGVSFGFYELGSGGVKEANYPAVAMENLGQVIAAKISAGGAFDYGDSVNSGVEELVRYTQKVAAQCPKTKFIIGGYSQGASVVSSALKRLNAEKIAYAATFGDPKLFLPEGEITDTDGLSVACRGKNLSDYRTHVPDCTVVEGVLAGTRPYQPTGYKGKLGTWCNLHDFMCGSAMDFGNIIAEHIAYYHDGSYEHASKVIAAAVKTQAKDKEKADEIANFASRDIAFLIDSSGSMAGLIDSYANYATKMAEKVVATGGRVALFEYRDLDDPFEARKLCDLGCSLDEFTTKIREIEVDGGGDTPESALSASLQTLNNLAWGKGATKNIIVLTDAPTLSPDRDGVTKEQVIKRAWEIDPVHISVVTETSDAEIVASFAEITRQTGGRIYGISEEEMELSVSVPLEDVENLTIPYLYGEIEKPSLSVTGVLQKHGEMRIDFEKSENTARVLVVVDDAVMGMTEENNVEIGDLDQSTSVKLIPISTTGHKGDAAEVYYKYGKVTPKAPNTGSIRGKDARGQLKNDWPIYLLARSSMISWATLGGTSSY